MSSSKHFGGIGNQRATSPKPMFSPIDISRDWSTQQSYKSPGVLPGLGSAPEQVPYTPTTRKHDYTPNHSALKYNTDINSAVARVNAAVNNSTSNPGFASWKPYNLEGDDDNGKAQTDLKLYQPPHMRHQARAQPLVYGDTSHAATQLVTKNELAVKDRQAQATFAEHEAFLAHQAKIIIQSQNEQAAQAQRLDAIAAELELTKRQLQQQLQQAVKVFNPGSHNLASAQSNQYVQQTPRSNSSPYNLSLQYGQTPQYAQPLLQTPPAQRMQPPQDAMGQHSQPAYAQRVQRTPTPSAQPKQQSQSLPPKSGEQTLEDQRKAYFLRIQREVCQELLAKDPDFFKPEVHGATALVKHQATNELVLKRSATRQQVSQRPVGPQQHGHQPQHTNPQQNPLQRQHASQRQTSYHPHQQTVQQQMVSPAATQQGGPPSWDSTPSRAEGHMPTLTGSTHIDNVRHRQKPTMELFVGIGTKVETFVYKYMLDIQMPLHNDNRDRRDNALFREICAHVANEAIARQFVNDKDNVKVLYTGTIMRMLYDRIITRCIIDDFEHEDSRTFRNFFDLEMAAIRPECGRDDLVMRDGLALHRAEYGNKIVYGSKGFFSWAREVASSRIPEFESILAPVVLPRLKAEVRRELGIIMWEVYRFTIRLRCERHFHQFEFWGTSVTYSAKHIVHRNKEFENVELPENPSKHVVLFTVVPQLKEKNFIGGGSVHVVKHKCEAVVGDRKIYLK